MSNYNKDNTMNDNQLDINKEKQFPAMGNVKCAMGNEKLAIDNCKLPIANCPRLRFPGLSGEWVEKKFGDLISESKQISTVENEDTLLTSSIDGMFLNSEIFSHQRGQSTIGYRKIKKKMLILSAQNLHLGNANVNMRFDSGLVSPAYKVYDIVGCLPEFMAQWIKKETTKQFFFNATTQGASGCRRNVVWEQLYAQTTLIPPTLAEQQKIADCLSALDETIAAEQQKVEALKLHKKGLMQQLFPEMRNEECEMGNGRVPQLRFPEFSGEWVEKKLGECFKIGNGKDYKHLSKGDIPVYGSGGYMCSVNDYLHDGESACIGRKGTINNPTFLRGKFWTVDTLFYTYDFKDTFAYFVYLLFQNIDWIKHNEAGGVPSLSKNVINNIKVFLPPTLAEQQKIADCLSALDDTIAAEQQKVKALKLHKKGLMQQLFPMGNVQ